MLRWISQPGAQLALRVSPTKLSARNNMVGLQQRGLPAMLASLPGGHREGCFLRAEVREGRERDAMRQSDSRESEGGLARGLGTPEPTERYRVSLAYHV